MDFLHNLFNIERQPGYSIGVLLDDDHDKMVREIWAELEASLQINHFFTNPVPHITHLQADKVKEGTLQAAVEQFAASHGPFTVRTAGLGIFTGERKAIYISCVRNPFLSAIHSAMITSFSDAVDGLRATHHINYWMPHVTLLLPEMIGDNVGTIVSVLAQRNFTWEMRITKLVVLNHSDSSPSPLLTAELTGTN